MNKSQEENKQLKPPGEGKNSAPTIINNNNVSNVSGGQGGGNMAYVGVRNDDPVLVKAQYGVVRTV